MALQQIPPNGITGQRLTDDVQMIERMERDLTSKAKVALGRYDMGDYVFGVFSVDDLELKRRDDLCGKMAVGVGYFRTVPVASETTSRAGALNPGLSTAAKTLSFEMVVMLAVPTNDGCSDRVQATAVLSALRMQILGSKVAGDPSNRTWDFVREGPEVEASSDTMLYYTQVWRVAIQCVGIST